MPTKPCQFCSKEIPIRPDELAPTRREFGLKMHEVYCKANPNGRETHRSFGPRAPVKITYCRVSTRKVVTEMRKVCTGPYHERPELLPLSEFYKLRRKSNSASKTAYYLARCKRCCNYSKHARTRPLINRRGVLLERYQWVFTALHSRMQNYAALAEVLGTNRGHAQRIVRGQQKRVNRLMLERAIRALLVIQQRGELPDRKAA